MTKYCFSDRKKSCLILKKFNWSFDFLSNRKALMSLIILVMFFVGSVYAIQINNMATKGFAVRSLETKILQLKKQNQQLSLQLTEMQTISNIKQRAGDLNLVEVNNLKYIDITPVLAQR